MGLEVTQFTAYTTLIDDATAVITYIGNASIGSSTAVAVWQIKRISQNGDVTTLAWAGGDSSFNKVWDSRVSYNYS